MSTNTVENDLKKTPEELVKEHRAWGPNFKGIEVVPAKLWLPYLDHMFLTIQGPDPVTKEYNSQAPCAMACFPGRGSAGDDGEAPKPQNGFTFGLENVRTGCSYQGFSEDTPQKEDKKRKASYCELRDESTKLAPLEFYEKYKSGGMCKDYWVSMNFSGFFDKVPFDPNSRKTTDEEKKEFCKNAINSAVFSKPGEWKMSIISPRPDPAIPNDTRSENDRALEFIEKHVIKLVKANQAKVRKYYQRVFVEKGNPAQLADELSYPNSFIHQRDKIKEVVPLSDADIDRKFHGFLRDGGPKEDTGKYKIIKINVKPAKAQFFIKKPHPKRESRLRLLNSLPAEAQALFLKKNPNHLEIDQAVNPEKIDTDFALYEWNKYGKFHKSTFYPRIQCWAGSLTYTANGGICLKTTANYLVRGNDENPEQRPIKDFSGELLTKTIGKDGKETCRYDGYVAGEQKQDDSSVDRELESLAALYGCGGANPAPILPPQAVASATVPVSLAPVTGTVMDPTSIQQSVMGEGDDGGDGF